MFAVVIALVLVLAAAGCGGSEPEPSDAGQAEGTPNEGGESPSDSADDQWDELVAAAQEEGQVVLYGAVAESVLTGIKQGFEDEFDITVDVQRLNAGPQRERVDQELATDQLIADVLINNDSPWVRSITDSIQSLEDAPAKDAFPEEWWVDQMPIVASFAQSVLVNTDAVDPSSLETWDDVLNPEFEGKIGMLEYGSGLGALTWYANLIDSQGEDFLRELAELDPVFYASTAPASQNVAAGELDLSLLNVAYTTVPLKEEGAPVEDVYLPPVSVVAYHAVALDGPHSAAAKLMVNWFLTEEGQAAICGDFKLTCSMPGIESSLPLPDEYEHYDPQEVSDRADELRATLDDIFGF